VPGLERADGIAWNEEAATADPGLQTHERRVARVGEADDEIVDAPEPLVTAVHERGSDQADRGEERASVRRHRDGVGLCIPGAIQARAR
jgi:hypothetical protein